MERGDHAMELNRLAFERNTKAFERLERTLDRHEQAFERHGEAFDKLMLAFDRFEKKIGEWDERMDERDEKMSQRLEENTLFIRDMNRRSERVVQDLVRGFEKFTAEQGQRTDEILAGLREGREESRAQREALLVLIDRLPPPAQAA